MQKSLFVFLTLATLCLYCEAKIFTRCELARELRKQGFPENKLRDWVCLVEAESSRNSRKVSPKNRNGSTDYGLFQINDKYWCTSTGPAGKDCNVTCAQVSSDDITVASTCAKKIFNRHGFNAWFGWLNKCQGALPDISAC